MKKAPAKLLQLLMFSWIALVSSSVIADKDKGFYTGAGVNLVSVGAEDIYRNGVIFKTGELMFGYKHSRFLIAEARIGTSLNDEIIAYDNSAALGIPEFSETGIDHFYSVYYRAELANEIAKIYLLVGQTQMQTTSVFEEVAELTLSDSGTSYGLGFGLWLDERMNLNFEYRVLVDTKVDQFAAASINADYRF